jgi:hypothetical protein
MIPTIENQVFEKWGSELKNIESEAFYFSFSKLKQFRISPYAFVQYMMNKKPTDSMNFGSIDHCYILEGETVFNSRYIVLDRDTDLRSNDSKDGKIGKIEFAEIQTKASLAGKSIVKKSELEKAQIIREYLMNDRVCRYLILDSDKEQKFSYSLDYNCDMYPFRGIIDGVGEGYKFDLKNIANFQSKNLRSHIISEKLHIQAAIYQMSPLGSFGDDYYILACNENGVLPILMKPALIEQGVNDLKRIIDKFEICKLENRWFESSGFWYKNGVLEIE